MASEQFIEKLRTALGESRVLTDEASITLAATDVYRQGALPTAVIKPATVEQLCAGIKVATEDGYAVIARGGGASYTDAYLAVSERTVVIDMGDLNKIVEIDEANNIVTVEAGCTWATLRDELLKRNLRTPFFGPFSGLVATVGGSVSQNAISHGSGSYGISAQSVISLDVVLASGEILRTGSGAVKSGDAKTRRFFRHSGPDLTGLFTGDCGALGIKASITLPLLKNPAATEAVAFSFPDFKSMHTAVAGVALLGLDDEGFGLDPALQQGQIARNEASAVKLKLAWSVLRSSPTFFKGIRSLLRMALAGDKHLREPGYALNYIAKGPDAGSAKSKIAAIREVALKTGGEVPNSMPAIVAVMPFAPLNNVLGPGGERWVPIHGILQHSDVVAFDERWRAVLDSHAEQIEATGAFVGGMYMAVGPNAFLYEIAFYWPDERTIYHEQTVDADFLGTLPTYQPNESGRELIETLKKAAIDLYGEYGGVHFQIGKSYPHAENRDTHELNLLRAIKKEVDPDNLMNPGVLGLQ
jgi:D-lactate dehydrogenase (cytochrome)